MDDAAEAMHTRSRNVTTDSVNANRSSVNRALDGIITRRIAVFVFASSF